MSPDTSILLRQRLMAWEVSCRSFLTLMPATSSPLALPYLGLGIGQALHDGFPLLALGFVQRAARNLVQNAPQQWFWAALLDLATTTGLHRVYLQADEGYAPLMETWWDAQRQSPVLGAILSWLDTRHRSF